MYICYTPPPPPLKTLKNRFRVIHILALVMPIGPTKGLSGSPNWQYPARYLPIMLIL